MLVVHPTGGYKGQIVSGLVCLTFPKTATRFLASRGFMANQNGPNIRAIGYRP